MTVRLCSSPQGSSYSPNITLYPTHPQTLGPNVPPSATVFLNAVFIASYPNISTTQNCRIPALIPPTIVSYTVVLPHQSGNGTFGSVIAKKMTVVDRMSPESSAAAVT